MSQSFLSTRENFRAERGLNPGIRPRPQFPESELRR